MAGTLPVTPLTHVGCTHLWQHSSTRGTGSRLLMPSVYGLEVAGSSPISEHHRIGGASSDVTSSIATCTLVHVQHSDQTMSGSRYRGKDVRGLGVNLSHLPSTSPPPPQPYSTPVAATLPESGALSQRIEAWFGSVEQFSDRIVQGVRFVVVDCVTYPHAVFSHQCQVYPYNLATPTLTTPLSSAVVLYQIAQTQGARAWWRGWYSHLALLIARPFADAILGRIVTPPRSLSDMRGKFKPLLGYLLLKGLACAFTVPLLSVNILEMVQNTHQKVYTNGPLEIIRDRPLLLVGKSQCLPFLYLIGPTILHRLALEWLSLLTSTLVQRSLPHRTNHDALSVAMRALWTSYLSSLMADAVLYPLETILVRLYCQGMPVLVDNVENGADVAFITTFYRGFFDCITGIWDSEGLWGFYRGFSALLLRYAVYGTVLFLLWRITHTHVHSVNGKTNR